jgi:heterokaryon incompatibility protein (HET)
VIVNGNILCGKTYEKIRKWLVTCDTKHPKCHKNIATSGSSDVTPAMVLDVSSFADRGREMVKLRRVAGQKMAYAALSYCWGVPQPNATSLSNIESYLKGIELLSLPQTLQDAVTVTRNLGLQYLWADSMCIIQDSDDDKAYEIGKMERIYSNAYVTISASSSADCTVGFLRQREPTENRIDVPFQRACKNQPNVTLCAHFSHRSKSYHIDPEPIHMRAWTFQEGFMSRRNLIYSRKQLFWSCAEVWGRDGGRMSRKDYYDMSGPRSQPYATVATSHHFLDSPRVEEWMILVQVYSNRQLGDPMDKLPALSSIASFFARKLDASYLAGLWSSHLFLMLYWTTRYGTKRACVWRAPSWSFFSIDGDIDFATDRLTQVDSETASKSFGCKIIACQAVPSSEQAPFGKLSYAALTIETRIIEITPPQSPGLLHKQGEAQHRDLPIRAVNTTIEIGRLFYDTVKYQREPKPPIVLTNDGDLPFDQPVWFLLLTATRVPTRHDRLHPKWHGPIVNAVFEPQWLPVGLALAKLPDGTYHRIGSIEGTAAGMKELLKKEPEQVTIV